MTLTITPEVRQRFLRSVLNNLAEYGFAYRSVHHEDGVEHGMTVSNTAKEATDLELCHIRLTNVDRRERKVGLLVVNEPDLAPVDMIGDIGAANESDIAIVERCIEGATSA